MTRICYTVVCMLIIGHRGACGLAPENTLASLRKAIEHHVDEIEFDLRVTKDGVPILHHDAALTDPNGSQLLVQDHTYAELQQHKTDLVSFDDMLAAIGHQTRLQVEVKTGEPVAPIVVIIEKYLSAGWLPEYFVLSSFDPKILRELQAALPSIEKVVLERWSGVRASYRARQIGTKRLSMNQKWLWWGFISSMSKAGWKLSAYTVNDAAKARRWQRYGLHSVITNYPDRFET